MPVSNREFELTSSFISLQVLYNQVLSERDLLKRQISALAEKCFQQERDIELQAIEIFQLSPSVPSLSYVPSAWLLVLFQYWKFYLYLHDSYLRTDNNSVKQSDKALRIANTFKIAYYNASTILFCKSPV